MKGCMEVKEIDYTTGPRRGRLISIPLSGPYGRMAREWAQPSRWGAERV